jgi:hypothetical protein
VPARAGRGGTGAGGCFWDGRGPASSMVQAGGGGVKGVGEGAVADSIEDVIIRDSISAEGRFPVDSLGGLVGVLGLTASSKDSLFEGDPSG